MNTRQISKAIVCAGIVLLAACDSKKRSSDVETTTLGGGVYGLYGEIELTINEQQVLLVESEELPTNWPEGPNPQRPTNTLFTFPEALEPGQSYEIRITRQPESQYCAVDSGDGHGIVSESSFIQVSCESFSLGLENVTDVSVGYHHACAISDGQVFCWGHNEAGQSDTLGSLSAPRLVAADGDRTCVVDETGIVCWGDLGDSGQHAPPDTATNVQELAMEVFSTCMIDDNGLYCWGHELSKIVTDVPQNLSAPSHLRMSDDTACVLDQGHPVCWGNFQSIVEVPEVLEEVSHIALGFDHACALQRDEVYCWGRHSEAPEVIVPEDLGPVVDLALGYSSSYAVTLEGIRYWGDERYRLNLDQYLEQPDRLEFDEVGGCAIDDGRLTCFGYFTREGFFKAYPITLPEGW